MEGAFKKKWKKTKRRNRSEEERYMKRLGLENLKKWRMTRGMERGEEEGGGGEHLVSVYIREEVREE